MKKSFASLGLFALLFSAALIPATNAAAVPSTSTISTPKGPILITAKFHASTQVEFGGKVIVVDPVSAASWSKKADVIFITHPHGDHLDLPAIAKILKPKGTVVAPESVAKSILTIHNITVLSVSPGSSLAADAVSHDRKTRIGVTFTAVPMYNLVRGPGPGKKFHPKESKWDGYVLTLGGKRLYFAGDTEAIPEMKALKNIDAAFLPMNLPFTMTPEEAAAGVKAFKPKRVYPYHYRYPFDKDSGNEKKFARLLSGSKTRVILLDWYPTAAVQKMMAAMKK